jgi:hypothetical protein
MRSLADGWCGQFLLHSSEGSEGDGVLAMASADKPSSTATAAPADRNDFMVDLVMGEIAAPGTELAAQLRVRRAPRSVTSRVLVSARLQ